MSLPKYSELDRLQTIQEIEEELFLLQKNLFELKMKRLTNQPTKPHLFVHTKRRIAQLKYKQTVVAKQQS
jgi:ribosomal protein L29